MEGLKFEIVETVGSISNSEDSWQKELNIVKWSDNEEKFDLRAWNKKHDKMSKGITLTTDELRRLKDLLNSLAI